MGKLIALELNNFKSYKGHHVLNFGDSYFTSIIGPNGSGKSNSMDAISFVLGIKSSHLRSTHLRELVYRGRVLKHSKINADGTATDDVNGDANGDAEAGASDDEDAETQASTQRNDPATGWVMAVYEDDAGEEQRWKRSITSSGSSEYRINNRVVTAKQYNEALEAENILIKARNFLVFQGDVESIANSNPIEKTRLIEQISGSVEYKEEYERLKVEKQNADEEQEYRLKQRRAINGEIRQFKEQKDELDKYEGMREEKDQAVVTHVLWKLFHFQRTIEDSTAEIQKHQQELKEFRRTVKKHEDKLAAAQKEHAEIGRNVSRAERDIKRKEKEIQEKENALVPIDEKLDISNKNLLAHQRKIAEFTKERESQEQTEKQLSSNLKKTEKAQKHWEDQFKAQQQQAGRELSDQDLQEYQRLRGEVYKRSGQDQIQVDQLARQLKTDEETVNSLKSKVDSTQTQVNALEAEVGGLQERRGEHTAAIKSTTKDIAAKKKAVNALASERERTRQKHDELDEKLLTVLHKLNDAQSAQRESRREQQQREMVSQLKRLFPGVKGMVHQLCRPKQKKYETAISTAMGRHWDDVVVDSQKTAQSCMDHLKEQRLSRITFVPLDTIIHEQRNANLRGIAQGVRLAIDTIDYDSNYERAMTYACGNALITDTLATARQLCYERGVNAKAVTLDGTVIHKGGNMTGGEDPTDRKRRFEEADVDNLRALADKFKADIEALPKGHKERVEEEQLQSELNGLEAKMKYAQDEVKALDRNIESKTKELQHVQRQLREVQPKYEDQAGGVETLRQQLNESKGSIEDVEDDVFAAFCQRLGYDSIRDYDRQQGSMQEEKIQKENEFRVQCSRLENSLQFETQRLVSTRKRIADEQKRMERDQQLVEELEAQKEELGGELDELNADVEQLNEQLAEVRQEYDQRAEKVSEARREVQKRQKSVDATLKAVAEAEGEAQAASTKRYTTLRQCKVENIDLPLEEGSRKLDSLPLGEGLLGEDEDAMDVDGEEAGQTNDYGIYLDFTSLDDDLQEDTTDEMETTLLDKIASLTTTLDKMAPNMRSAERLTTTHDRLTATERDFNASRSAARAATKAFERVRKQRADLFNRAYTHIAEQIGTIYKELTKTLSFPLGGQAHMSLEDDDEPYLAGVKYHAMPPLKRFRDMEHLSGGEKTMAALALLFAVHTYAPSPFFVLDEVDAALDNANTAQLANYVREHAGPGMQFVVISLKTGLFQNSETLVGVMRDQGVNSSRVLTLDVSISSSLGFMGLGVVANVVLAVAEVSGCCLSVTMERENGKEEIGAGVLCASYGKNIAVPRRMDVVVASQLYLLRDVHTVEPGAFYGKARCGMQTSTPPLCGLALTIYRVART
ncbi:Structural maintenance of chromosomes protein 1B [Saxophila tyrrhenica]|uniref:Structural maintenance of chromosomes protein n=1 Tax=Saxophila tyrrhenica TaxID=1690608 RepID=A0AAV9PH09_9PEZI|nr:Structural maintenance of chromosomes protein 1B [Saxophila tyrrhenica]